MKLPPGMKLRHYATVGERNDDGSIARTVKLYEIIGASTINPATNLTPEEETACDEMAKKAYDYMKGSGMIP